MTVAALLSAQREAAIANGLVVLRTHCPAGGERRTAAFESSQPHIRDYSAILDALLVAIETRTEPALPPRLPGEAEQRWRDRRRAILMQMRDRLRLSCIRRGERRLWLRIEPALTLRATKPAGRTNAEKNAIRRLRYLSMSAPRYAERFTAGWRLREWFGPCTEARLTMQACVRSDHAANLARDIDAMIDLALWRRTMREVVGVAPDADRETFRRASLAVEQAHTRARRDILRYLAQFPDRVPGIGLPGATVLEAIQPALWLDGRPPKCHPRHSRA